MSLSQRFGNCPVRCAFAVIAAIALRFGWIVGHNDYGWTFEPALRVRFGEVQFRDFLTPLPPLPHYTLGGLFYLLGPQLWLAQVHLYMWWIASVLACLLLARTLFPYSRPLIAALVIVSAIANPPYYMQHEYNFAAPAFLALAIFFSLRCLKLDETRWLAAAGAACAIAIYAKQSVGLMGTAGIALGLVSATVAERGISRVLLARAALFAAAFACFFGAVAAYFSAHIGLAVFAQRMFQEAGAGKGGLMMILGRSLPRLNLTLNTASRRAIESLLTIVLISLFAWYLNRRSPRVTRLIPGFPALLALFLISMSILFLVSLAPIPSAAALFTHLSLPWIGWFPLLMQTTYIFLWVVGALGMIQAVRAQKRVEILLSFSLLFALIGHGSSSLNYPLTTMCIAAPLAIHLMMYLGARERASEKALAWCCICLLLLGTFEGYRAHAFETLTPMPPPFTGLWAGASAAEMVNELKYDAAPWNRSESTVWVAGPFPYAAIGGKLTFASVSLAADVCGPATDRLIQTRWQQSPPRFVFLEREGLSLPSCPFVGGSGIRDWLTARYQHVWRGDHSNLDLWRLKE